MSAPPRHDPEEKPEFPLMANRPLQVGTLSPFRELYTQGVRLLQVDATFSEDLFHSELRAWKAPGVFDYSYQEAYWTKLLEACPEAGLCLRLSAASPPWWDERHPEELQRYADGSVEAPFQRTSRRTLPSLASTVWRRASREALAHFLRWLNESGWSKKIWGLFLAYGITWEWGILGTGRFPDYSEAMQQRFREWLREAYESEAELQRCWGDARVTFDMVKIPTREARLTGHHGLRIFPQDRAAADFQNCLSAVNCEYLLALGQTVRDLTGSRYKLGTFYGYTLTAREHTPFTAQYGPGGLAGGHHAFGNFLRSGLFDFNASPYAYANRELGSGCLIQHFPRASCQHHGVRVYEENDLRTFLVAGLPDDRTISIGQSETLDESLEHQRWAAAQALCHGTSYWWTELSGWIGPYQPNFDHPDILEELRRHAALFRQSCKEAEPEKAEIALIIDERAVAALALESKLLKREIYDQLAAWSWCGAPFDVWLAEDVEPSTMARARLAYVFSPAPSDALREKLRTTLCGAGRTVWWSPWTGTLTEHGLDNQAFEKLTAHDNPDQHETLRRKDFESWTSLYGNCAGRTASELSEIARAAGVRIFGEAPLQVMKGARFLALQANRDREISLDGLWRDVWADQKIEGSTVMLRRNKVVLLKQELLEC